MIYQVKIDQAVLFTGDMAQTIEYLQHEPNRYPLEWLMVYGYDMGKQEKNPPYQETAQGFIR